MPELNAQSFLPQTAPTQLEVPNPIQQIQTPELVQRQAAGDFSQDPTSQVFQERLGLARQQNQLIQEALQRQFASSLEQAQGQAKKLIGTQKSQLSRIGALGTTASGVTAQTEFERKVNQGISDLQTEQQSQLAQTAIQGQSKELDIIEAQYGLEARKQAESLAQQLEIEKENAKIQTLNQETQLAISQFNEEAKLKGLEEARKSAEAAGYVVTNDGQLIPTFAKEQEVQRKIEQDRRYQLDQQIFQAEQQARQQELALQAASLTGELEGVKTLSSRSVELEANKLQEQIRQFNEQQALSQRQQGFTEDVQTKTLGLQEQAQNFDQAIQTAQSLVQQRLADNTIKKTDADIIIGNLESIRQDKLTNQQIRESDVNIANKIAEELRNKELFPYQIEQLKAQTANIQSQTQLTQANISKARAAIQQAGKNIELTPGLQSLVNSVTDNEFNIIAEEFDRLNDDERKLVLSAYSKMYNDQLDKASVSAAEKKQRQEELNKSFDENLGKLKNFVLGNGQISKDALTPSDEVKKKYGIVKL